METFTYRGKTLDFRSITGTVLDTSTRSETHISGGGGGGYIGPKGGHIDDISIRSHNTTLQEFWIKTEDGMEKSVNISGTSIPLRAGQRITLIAAEQKGRNEGWYASVINHNANQFSFICDGASLNNLMKLEVFPKYFLFIGFALWLALAIALRDGGLAAFFAVMTMGIFAINKNVRIKRLISSLNAHIEKVSQPFLQRG
jgi:hypothetical protein